MYRGYVISLQILQGIESNIYQGAIMAVHVEGEFFMTPSLTHTQAMECEGRAS